MKKNLTKEWIGELLEQTENHLVKATQVYQNLSEEQLLQPASNGGWSVAQCLEHLNSYGRYYIPAVQSRISLYKGLSEVHFKSGFLGKYFINLMKNTKGSKLKAFKDHIPSATLNGSEVVAEFINQQEQWLEILRETEQVNLNKIKVPISISKFVKLKLGDVLAFIKAHDERHLQQADRVMNT